jgi:di/tricarboxylate transporter
MESSLIFNSYGKLTCQDAIEMSPLLTQLTDGYWPHKFTALLVLAVSAFHYVMPFHHVTVMIGYGSGYYENRHILKFGVLLTPLVIILVFFCYVPWWKLMGIAP